MNMTRECSNILNFLSPTHDKQRQILVQTSFFSLLKIQINIYDSTEQSSVRFFFQCSSKIKRQSHYNQSSTSLSLLPKIIS